MMRFFIFVFTAVATMFIGQSYGQPASYQIPITLSNGIYSTILRLGVNPGNSVGIDTSTALGTFREVPAPPAPPQPFAWDTRFMTIPGRVSTFPVGLSGGVVSDYRGYVSASQVDSFKIIIQGDETDNAATTVSWPTNLADFGTSWTIKPQAGSDWPATNMLASPSVVIDGGLHKNIIIIKVGAINLPVQLASFSGVRSSTTSVRLDWRTISEVNNYGFFVERSLPSDSVFSELASSFVSGHGTTNEPQHYTFTDGNAPQSSLLYRLKQVDLDGSVHLSEPIQIDNTTDVNENSPSVFMLSQNSPNPFNPSTNISFTVAGTSGSTSLLARFVSLKVFDVLGREVATLVNEEKTPGTYTVSFDAATHSSGLYLYQLVAGSYIQTKKMILAK